MEAADTTLPTLDNMRDETQRLLSFLHWPLSQPTPEALARAGFFSCELDVCECAFCGLRLNNWQPDDVPLAEHRRWNPICPLVQEQDRVVAAGSSSLPTRPAGTDETGRHVVPQHGEFHPARGGDLPVGPTVREMATEESRLRTFARWPEHAHPSPEALAGAGFFYTGREDRVRCLYCGVIVGAWEPQDEPWAEHARLSPGCCFVRLLRSSEGRSTREQTGPTGAALRGEPGRPILGRRMRQPGTQDMQWGGTQDRQEAVTSLTGSAIERPLLVRCINPGRPHDLNETTTVAAASGNTTRTAGGNTMQQTIFDRHRGQDLERSLSAASSSMNHEPSLSPESSASNHGYNMPIESSASIQQTGLLLEPSASNREFSLSSGHSTSNHEPGLLPGPSTSKRESVRSREPSAFNHESNMLPEPSISNQEISLSPAASASNQEPNLPLDSPASTYETGVLPQSSASNNDLCLFADPSASNHGTVLSPEPLVSNHEATLLPAALNQESRMFPYPPELSLGFTPTAESFKPREESNMLSVFSPVSGQSSQSFHSSLSPNISRLSVCAGPNEESTPAQESTGLNSGSSPAREPSAARQESTLAQEPAGSHQEYSLARQTSGSNHLPPAPARHPASREQASRGTTSTADLSPFIADYQRLRDERLCKICMEEDACVVFLPCGHLATCARCAVTLQLCCVCRAHIGSLVKAYMA